MSEILTKSGKLSQKSFRELMILKAQLSDKRSLKNQLKKEADSLKYDIDLLEGRLIQKLEQGVKVSPGIYFPIIRVRLIKPRLAWRELFEKYVKNGVVKAEKLMDERVEYEENYIQLERRK